MVWNFLAWRNRYTIGPLTQDMTQGEGLYDPLSFPDEETPIRLTFEMSLAEFTKVYTALNKGAILSYPDESEDVIWYFLRNFEFPIMPDCTDVQDCIENDTPTRETIQQIFQGGTAPAGGTVMAENDELDRLFGMVRFLVDTAHDAIVDVFQIADDTSDLRERATLLFSAIPGAQLLPFDEGANYIDSLLEDIGQQFDGQYTTTPETGSRDRISCGLFCLARANGNTLTWAMIRDWFWQQVSYESPGLNQFVDFANFLITGSWAGQDLVNISFANLASALDASARYGDLLFPSLGAIMALGANNPDSDWEILCLDCPPVPIWVNAGEGTGTITLQTETEVQADADPNPDSIYRLVIRRYDGACFEIDTISGVGGATYPAYYDCDGVLIAEVPVVNDTSEGLSIASLSPFSVTMTYTVI